MTVLDRYFELSDVAGSDDAAFNELIGLFADDAVVKPAGAAELKGKRAVTEFYEGFLKRNAVLRHVWTTRAVAGGLETDWAVAGRRLDGTLIALKGVDTAQLDANGKIARLEVQFA